MRFKARWRAIDGSSSIPFPSSPLVSIYLSLSLPARKHVGLKEVLSAVVVNNATVTFWRFPISPHLIHETPTPQVFSTFVSPTTPNTAPVCPFSFARLTMWDVARTLAEHAANDEGGDAGGGGGSLEESSFKERIEIPLVVSRFFGSLEMLPRQRRSIFLPSEHWVLCVSTHTNTHTCGFVFLPLFPPFASLGFDSVFFFRSRFCRCCCCCGGAATCLGVLEVGVTFPMNRLAGSTLLSQ